MKEWAIPILLWIGYAIIIWILVFCAWHTPLTIVGSEKYDYKPKETDMPGVSDKLHSDKDKAERLEKLGKENSEKYGGSTGW